MRILLVIFLIVFSRLFSMAYDMVVVMSVENTSERLNDYVPFACDPEKNDTILAYGERLPSPGEFLLRSLPEKSIAVLYAIGEDYFGVEVSAPRDTLEIRIPALFLPQQLGDVTVQAQTTYLTDDKTVFSPTKREKRISATGADLIMNMGIPTLSVNPLTGDIQTVGREDVKLFIDYLPATSGQVADLRTMDVEKIETLDYPKDPRFRGADHVVNFIMVKYEYGGYGKARGTQKFIDDKTDVSASARLSYRRTDFYLSAGFSRALDTHIGSDQTDWYGFPGLDVTRKAETGKGRNSQRTGYTSLRMVNRTESLTISNTVGLTVGRTPSNERVTQTDYSPEVYASSLTGSLTSASSISPSWSGGILWKLPHSVTLSVDPGLTFGHFTNDYSFRSAATELRNNARENTWSYNISARLSKMVGRYTLSFNISNNGDGNHQVYTGDRDARVTTRRNVSSASLRTSGSFGKLRVMAYGGITHIHTSVNGESTDQNSPDAGLNMSMMVGNRSRMNLNFKITQGGLPLSNQSATLQRLNDIDAVAGNPLLRQTVFFEPSVSQQWFPNDVFSMGYDLRYEYGRNPLANIYSPLDGSEEPVMVRTVINSGAYRIFTYSLLAQVRLFNRSLMLQAGLDGFAGKRTGVFSATVSDLRFKAYANYTWRNFFARISWQSPFTGLSMYSRYHTPEYYYLTLGWGNGDWLLSAYTANPFRSSWTDGWMMSAVENFRSRSVGLASTYHRTFGLTVTYSFSYGKKMKREEIVNDLRSAESGILK